VEGFYAVEQYAPDYTAQLTQLARQNYGQSQFQIRWGAEEEKHADLWRNVLLFTRARTADRLEEYTKQLRANAWTAPFDTPLQMLFYTVFQERATQLIYLNLGRIAMGQHPEPCFDNDKDPALVDAISAIAIDEAAHFDFFLSVARLYLYYFPEASLKALVDVLRNFTMPAAKIIPNYEAFIKVLYEAQLFGPRMYGRDVAKPALAALGIDTIKAVEAGIQATRDVPDQQGAVQSNPVFAGCTFSVVESAVHRLFDRIGRYEQQVGLSTVDCTTFVPHTWF
jgi:acyl-[acyl-carrier-protein] desaturase